MKQRKIHPAAVTKVITIGVNVTVGLSLTLRGTVTIMTTLQIMFARCD
ncbi:hypothetical protein O9929_09090 [Vibrio lentus]|nr:hypothetical protein [Vibrio lentus]